MPPSCPVGERREHVNMSVCAARASIGNVRARTQRNARRVSGSGGEGGLGFLATKFLIQCNVISGELWS